MDRPPPAVGFLAIVSIASRETKLSLLPLANSLSYRTSIFRCFLREERRWQEAPSLAALPSLP